MNDRQEVVTGDQLEAHINKYDGIAAEEHMRRDHDWAAEHAHFLLHAEGIPKTLDDVVVTLINLIPRVPEEDRARVEAAVKVLRDDD